MVLWTSGLISSIGETKLSIYTFTNALALDAAEEKLSIINMEFASGDETNAEFHAQAIMEVESNPDTRMLTAETTINLGITTDDEGNEVENKKVISFPLSWNEDGKTTLSVFYVAQRQASPDALLPDHRPYSKSASYL